MMQRTVPEYRPVDLPVLYFGTPVALLSTVNPDGTFNLAPMSSYWALGDGLMLGLGADGRTARNLMDVPEVVINLPTAGMVDAVERLAPLTGMDPVPEGKRHRSRFEPDKWSAAHLTPLPSEVVQPPRVAGCPFQIEARRSSVHTLGTPDAQALAVEVEVEVVRVHADVDVMHDDGRHVRVDAWRPLLYMFRHYVATGASVGRSIRATDPVPAAKPPER